MIYTIAGLGNPGVEYEKTRHNTGRIILENIRSARKLPEWEKDKKTNALTLQEAAGENKIAYVMPETFMNKSGTSVSKFIKNAKQAERLVVVYDDLDLPIGTFKISFDRGSGGHRGVGSIIKSLRTKAFMRIRVGISPSTPAGKLKKPKGEDAVLKFIMKPFTPNEEKTLKKLSKKIDEAIQLFIKEGRGKAMNTFN